jgi:hypothetical protein
MKLSTGDLLLLISIGLIVAVMIYWLVWKLWNYPLRHGPGFFLNVEVAAGFYDGPGVRWLKRYRTVLVVLYLLLAVVLAVLLVSGRWEFLPVWAGSSAPLFVITQFSFMAWTRHTLDANPPVRPSVAVSLETRRLSDYISWPMEALVAVLIVFSWSLLLTHAGAKVHWQDPVVTTYGILALFAAKIVAVRNRFPLPAERAEEHYRWLEAHRRHSLRVIDVMRWFALALLASIAILTAWPPARSMPWLRWALAAVALGIWLVQVLVQERGDSRLATMGRDLRPMASWSGPFQPPKLMTTASWIWGASFLTGLVLLLILFRH